VPNNIV